MKNLFLLYFFLLLFIVLSKFFSVFFYVAFFILVSPLIFMDLKKIGLKNFKKGFIYGFISSSIYLPFIWDRIFYGNFTQIGQVFAEEIFFRGYLLTVLPVENLLLRNITVSFLFMLPHLVINPNIFSLLTFFPSLIFGYLFIKTGSIVAPTIFHLFSNLFFQLFVIDKL
ncbi:CPBP family glutamic-type intramembrane protease [Persephonella sp.]